jgi:hypothetical protein
VLDSLILTTAAACVIAVLYAVREFRDPFHPLVLTGPIFLYVYAYLPWVINRSKASLDFLDLDDLIFYQSACLIATACFFVGCTFGSYRRLKQILQPTYSTRAVWFGALALGSIGIACWVITVRNVGGLAAAFSQPKGGGWSDWGYLRDAPLLLFSAMILILVLMKQPRPSHIATGVAFLLPWATQGLLGARRGPTFMVIGAVALAWYLGHKRRPATIIVLGSGLAVGLAILLLVHNRGQLFLGSEDTLNTNISELSVQADQMNEYIYGAAVLVSAMPNQDIYWGHRYLAQLVVRPVPRQLWPTKYIDFGVPDIEFNAGTARRGIHTFGWEVIPGAAPAIVADLWLECWWGALFAMFALGYGIGALWKRAVKSANPWWSAQYVVAGSLTLYFIMQTMEAVIFRFMLITLPMYAVWRLAQRSERRTRDVHAI